MKKYQTTIAPKQIINKLIEFIEMVDKDYQNIILTNNFEAEKISTNEKDYLLSEGMKEKSLKLYIAKQGVI